MRSITKIWWYDWFWLLESTFFQKRSKCVPFQSVYSNFTLDFLNFRKGDVNQFQRYCFKSFMLTQIRNGQFIGNLRLDQFMSFRLLEVMILQHVVPTGEIFSLLLLPFVIGFPISTNYLHFGEWVRSSLWIILIDSWEFGWSESGAKMQNLRNDCLF